MEGAQAAADAGGRTGKQQTLTDSERVLGPGRATPTSSRRVEAARSSTSAKRTIAGPPRNLPGSVTDGA
jgi:hypothetical protein